MLSYLEGFMWPLIDECRASLMQSLEKIRGIDFQRIDIIRPPHHGMDSMRFTLPSPPKFDLKPTDLVLITTCERPKKKQDLFVPHVLYTLGVVEFGNKSDDGESELPVQVGVWAPQEAPVTIALQNGGAERKKDWFVAVLDSLATSQRIWQALHTPVQGNLTVLYEAFLAGQGTASIFHRVCQL